MRVKLREATDFGLCDVLPPKASIGDVEALSGSEAVDLGDLLAFVGHLQSEVSDGETALVSDVLSERQLPISLETWSNRDSRELLSEALRGGFELLTVFGCPPVIHVPILIEVRSFVVEAVRHLVTDDDTDRTVVHSVICIHIEEGRLQDTCGEADLVGRGHVVGIDLLRAHEPLRTVNGLAEILEVVCLHEACSCFEVLVVRLALIDVEGAVVHPLVGVTDLDDEAA